VKIFISYRRADSAALSGRIYDRLTAHFGRSAVLKDVDSIPVGVDFSRFISEAIISSDVVLVVIGRQWLRSTDDRGRRRIDHPTDFIRLEIETALAAAVPLIPVLVDDATMPRADELPPSIVQLSHRNGFQIRLDPYFDDDMRRVISSIEHVLASPPIPSVPQPEPTGSQDLEPPEERKAALEIAYGENRSQGRPPYQDVPIFTRGELRSIIAVRSWSGEPGANDEQRIDLSGAQFLAPNLSGIHLHGANLTGAVLEGCNLIDAVLAETILDNANLRRAVLARSDLRQARLNEADLEGADLERANLSEATLKGARLSLANLAGASLQDATLDGVDLSSAKMSDVVLDGADLRGADLHDLELEKVHLRGAQLIEANLVGVNLKGADLREAVLERARLEGSDVSGAAMDKANLLGATLEGANFSGTSLVGARLDSVGVLSSINLDPRTRLDHAAWGGVSVKEQGPSKTRAARIARYREEARQSRRLAIALRGQGLLAMASKYRLIEQKLERRASLWDGRFGTWLFSWLLDVVAGYGERPGRAFRTYLIVIASFAAVYFAVTNADIASLTSGSQPLQWYEALVLSLSSFHGRGFFPQTLNLGDPVAIAAACEAVIGLFIELVFIATFSRRFLGN